MGNVQAEGLIPSGEDITGQEYNNIGDSITDSSFYYYYYITFKRNQRGVAVKDTGHPRSKSHIYIYGGNKSVCGYPKTY